MRNGKASSRRIRGRRAAAIALGGEHRSWEVICGAPAKLCKAEGSHPKPFHTFPNKKLTIQKPNIFKPYSTWPSNRDDQWTRPPKNLRSLEASGRGPRLPVSKKAAMATVRRSKNWKHWRTVQIDAKKCSIWHQGSPGQVFNIVPWGFMDQEHWMQITGWAQRTLHKHTI